MCGKITVVLSKGDAEVKLPSFVYQRKAEEAQVKINKKNKGSLYDLIFQEALQFDINEELNISNFIFHPKYFNELLEYPEYIQQIDLEKVKNKHFKVKDAIYRKLNLPESCSSVTI